MYVLVLGLDVLGNPFGLIRGLGEGLEDLFYEPYQVNYFKFAILKRIFLFSLNSFAQIFENKFLISSENDYSIHSKQKTTKMI